MRRSVFCGCLGGALAVIAGYAGSAQASFPGTNGKIVFSQSNSIHTMNPDGGGEQTLISPPPNRNDAAWSPDGTKLAYRRGVSGSPPNLAIVDADGANDHEITSNSSFEFHPAWSPDGSKVAHVRLEGLPAVGDVYVVDAAGGTPVRLTVGADAWRPSWSPDGTKIAFDAFGGADWDIWTINPDGSGAVNLTNTPAVSERSPDWSPDGTRIAYARANEPQAVRVMNADGTGDAFLVAAQGTDRPDWSPDGTKVVYDDGTDIHVVNADGTGQMLIRAAGGDDIDWQPIPVNVYPRPKGAGPLRASLVPAYAQCTSANRAHGPPLAFGSCHPPAQTSDELTVGTPDANGKAARSQSFVKLGVQVGNPATSADEADVRVRAEINDVYTQAGLADYVGELRARFSLRITDKRNVPAPGGEGAGTTSDFSYEFTVPCGATADPGTGGACALDTTADALAPGTVAESKRAIWQIGRVEVDDGGADADADTPGDNALFLTQGLFVP